MKRLKTLAVVTVLLFGLKGLAQTVPTTIREYHQTVRDYRQQITEILAGESDEFQALLDKEDKTFEDLQAIAAMRQELLAESEAAQAVQAELDAYREEFIAEHPNLIRPPRPRPELTDEEKAILAEHKAAIQEKNEALNQIPTAASERYAELLAKDDRTLEENREMLDLRRELIAASEEAQAIVDEIQDLIATFREENPDLVRPPRPGRRTVLAATRTMEAVKELNCQIDAILAETSDEYAELLAKEDKTAEDLARLRELREELVAENDELQGLVRSAGLLRHRLAHIRKPALRLGDAVRPALPGDPVGDTPVSGE